MLEQYKISDFIDWHKRDELVLRTDFQRNEVWTPAARSYLVDTILREYPIPKIYLRSTVNVETQKRVREVIDGQQRLSAIFAFAKNDLRVTTPGPGGFKGHSYKTLGEELRERFLNYPLAVHQLVNADNSVVLEVFARLNTYTVVLSPAELRHAKFQGEFKADVRAMSREWGGFMEKIFSMRQMIRMENDSLMAEMLGVAMEGLRGGGQPAINKLYEKYDAENSPPIRGARLLRQSGRFWNSSGAIWRGSLSELRLCVRPISSCCLRRWPIAAAAFRRGIWKVICRNPGKKFPKCGQRVMDKLRTLAVAINHEPPHNGEEREFWRQSNRATTNIASRKVRFKAFFRALNG